MHSCARKGVDELSYSLETIMLAEQYQRTPNTGRFKPVPLMARLLAHTSKTETCWLWTGSVFKSSGYGACWVDPRTIGAHRASWIAHFGEIPEGMFVCHRCDVPLCVRPDHLFLGTPADNTRDMQQKGRNRKPACRKGHAFTPENTLLTKSGRVCRTCRREYSRMYWRKYRRYSLSVKRGPHDINC